MSQQRRRRSVPPPPVVATSNLQKRVPRVAYPAGRGFIGAPAPGKAATALAGRAAPYPPRAVALRPGADRSTAAVAQRGPSGPARMVAALAADALATFR